MSSDLERYPAWFRPRVLASLIKAAESGGSLRRIVRRARAHHDLSPKALSDFLRRHRPPTDKNAKHSPKQMFVAEFNRRRGQEAPLQFHTTPRQAERVFARAMNSAQFACNCGAFKRSRQDDACVDCLAKVEPASVAA